MSTAGRRSRFGRLIRLGASGRRCAHCGAAVRRAERWWLLAFCDDRCEDEFSFSALLL